MLINTELIMMLDVHCHFSFQKSNLPSAVKIVEVGPRDGLQNEKVSCLVVLFCGIESEILNFV